MTAIEEDMRLLKLTTLPTAFFLLYQATLGTAYAGAFVCKDIAFTRMMAGDATASDNLIPKSATLYLKINATDPSRSTLRWSGAPAMRDATSTWPAGTRIIVVGGVVVASFAASKDGISSVGTVTLDAKGALRVVENTVTSKGQVVFDVLEATCRKEQED